MQKCNANLFASQLRSKTFPHKLFSTLSYAESRPILPNPIQQIVKKYILLTTNTPTALSTPLFSGAITTSPTSLILDAYPELPGCPVYVPLAAPAFLLGPSPAPDALDLGGMSGL